MHASARNFACLVAGLGLSALTSAPPASALETADARPPAAALTTPAALPYAAPESSPAPTTLPVEPSPVPPRPAVDTTVLRDLVDLYRSGRIQEADAARATVSDKTVELLTEWLAIRSGAALPLTRIVAFLRDNPDWPGLRVVRRRAEEEILRQRPKPDLVFAFFAGMKPETAAGKFALALAFQAEGADRDAAALIRDAWRRDTFGKDLEERMLQAFPGVLAREDHRVRMERFLLKESWTSAERAARYAGADYLKLVAARRAVERSARTAGKALDAVPAALRTDTSYVFSKAKALRRTDQFTEAAKLLAGISRDPEVLAEGDEWWVERRVLARELLDIGEHKLAYDVAREHGAESDSSVIEAEFHAGWIALRFLDDPKSAATHFAAAARVAETPISVARVAYWRGRAAEAANEAREAQRHYERAAAYGITYYGQLALGKLGRTSLALRAPPEPDAAARAAFADDPAVKAIRLLHQIDADELALPLYTESGRRRDDPVTLDLLGRLAVEMRDARALLALGKAAIHRGLPLDSHAYPTLGIPDFETVGDRGVETAMVYAIARQESAFNPRAKSHAGARGLMQLMPDTARRTARRFGIDFELDRLLSDPAYNAKLGSAHLGELMEDWRGSYVLAFASYNAGGGNVKKWIDRYGDPRRHGTDPIDWVERIPFTETRNYVQRVMENFQVYRRRLDTRSALVLEDDLRRSETR